MFCVIYALLHVGNVCMYNVEECCVRGESVSVDIV